MDSAVLNWTKFFEFSNGQRLRPMTQDFFAAFSLNGEDNRHISAGDEGGVALAAIQGLNQKLDSDLKRRAAENEELKKENEILEKRLEDLERAVKALSEKQKR